MTNPSTQSPEPGAADRAPQVQAMFDQIAPKYDLANRVLSLGLDQWWRRIAISALGDTLKGDVLDLCAGTLDLTLMLVEAGAQTVTAIDFSEEMLRAGESKIPPEAQVETIAADARSLPLADQSVDGIVCGFGLRNVPELEKALAECARVLRPGGRLVVLDFFQPEGVVSRFLHSTYNRVAVPVVGGWITGAAPAYRYLTGSIEAFVSRTEFETMLSVHGFAVEGKEMTPPVASLVVGSKSKGVGHE